MFLMWVVPVLLIGLSVYVISGNSLGTVSKPITNRICLNCNTALQNDWKACPHCGQAC